MQLDQVKAVITGGASGLGFAVARRLVAAGAQVALFDVNAERAQAALAELGGAAHFFRTEVTSEDNVAASLAAAQVAMGGLNAAISCAGILGAGRVLGKDGPMPLQNFAGTVMVNLVGSFNVAKAAANRMQHNEAGVDGERGVIINTASIAAYDGTIGQAAYAAAKGGIVSMTLPLARDLAPAGIRVVTIAPGTFLTPAFRDADPEQLDAYWGAAVPFPKRMGRAGEYASLAQHIAENVYLNGETIRLDGALRFTPKGGK